MRGQRGGREDPFSDEAAQRRQAVAGVIMPMFPGSEATMGRDHFTLVIHLPLNAGTVTIRSTTSGTEDMDLKVEACPVEMGVLMLVQLAAAWESRLAYLRRLR